MKIMSMKIRKILSIALTLVMLLGLFPGMSLTAYAADEVSENISLVASPSANLKTISGTHYSVSCGYMCANDSGMQVCKSGALTINARKGETITKVVLTYSWGNNKSSLSASAGTFDGNATISDINAQQVTISSSNTAGVKISAVTVYFEGSLSNPTVTLTGGANAKSSGGLLTQSYLPGAMDTVTYTALTGAAFPEFETFTQNGVTVERTSDTVVTISGTPTANTEITVPDAESSSKMVTWGSSIINDSGRNGLEYQIRRNNSYSDTANGITLTKSGSGNVGSDWCTYGSLELNFTTATGKFTSIEIETSQIYDGGNWTKDGNTLKWNGTPSNSVSLSGSGLYLEGVSSINFVIEMPTVSVTITPGSNMTKTTDSGDAEQTGLTGAMADVVYTAVDGYYYPTDYSVAEVSGIKVTRDSYTQITVSGTPTADAAIALTAPTAKTTPDAPTTATATDCTTADNNDGTLTGVTTAMEYKKSDAADWTAGTGSDITGLVPGTYYVRVKATDTTNASGNQELTIKGFISYTVTFKVVNGKWNEGEGDAATADKTVTLTGHDGDTLKLTADQIPAVGTKPNDTYKVGSWDTTPSADTEIAADTTYTYTYAQKDAISQTVTFKVVNGSWNDETTTDKTVTLTGYEGDTLKLAANQIPAVGTKPNDTYKAGSWDVTPSAETEITAATTYTYTYAQKDTISQTVTFKVANGSWNDETTADKTVTLTGYEGDTLKLAADQIPAVGTKPNDTYKAGSWDVTPSTETEITAATTYTYTYVAKEASVVTKAPEAKTLTYNGQAQELVTAGTATGGEMQYALGNENGATQPYTTSIPAKTNAGTYYVWYKVNGDENHNDVDPACVEAKINPVDKTALDSAISAAETYYNQIKDNADYADIASALNTAITNATAVKNNANVTSGAVATAVTAINTAKTTAEAGVKDVDDTKAANAVITAINDLPEADEVTAENEKAIIEARKAYDALTTDQKKKVSADILNKLTATETALNTVNTSAAKDVTDAITDLPAAADVKDSDEAAIKAARAAYDKLTDTQKGLVSDDTLKKLTDAEKALDTVNTNAAKEVSDAIAKLPASDKVAATDKEAIEAARKAYDALTADQKKKVSDDTLKKLTDAETALDTLNKNSAKAVTDAIGKLPASDKVATTDKDAIEAAKKAYDALTPDQKKLVDDATLKKLTDAETALKAAQKKEADDTSAADKVVSTITALPVASKVTTTDKASIEAARKAYDALTADQKKKVSADTLKKLTDAETALTAAEKKAAEDKAAAEKKAAEEKAARELAAAKQEAQAAMNEQVTVTQKGNKFTVKWKKSSAADGYYVYAQYCGKKITKPAKTIAKNTTTKTTITKINGKKINQKRQFRVYVVPYKIIDGKKVALGKSIGAHLVGAKSTKYSNVKKLTLTKSKYTVKVGKTAKIKAKVTLVNKNKKHIPKSHGAKFRYKSSDTSIATVDKNGKIKGIKKGTCTIYVYSINGLMKKAKVTIK